MALVFRRREKKKIQMIENSVESIYFGRTKMDDGSFIQAKSISNGRNKQNSVESSAFLKKKIIFLTKMYLWKRNKFSSEPKSSLKVKALVTKRRFMIN